MTKFNCLRCRQPMIVEDIGKSDGICDSCSGAPDFAPPILGSTPLSVRDWSHFATQVREHVGTYVVPQYGDKGQDEATHYTAAECVAQVRKYASRHGKNSRPGQDQLDLLKMAHYAQLAWTKIQEGKQ